jgi:hypothetical protein
MDNFKIRWGWLKGMYIYTIVGAGLLGLVIVLMPNMINTLFKFDYQEPLLVGVIGSVWLAFGILSIFGLRSPLKFVPVLLMQLFYKSIWIVSVVIPLLFSAKISYSDALFILIMLTYVFGDLIAIPFRYVFSQKMEQ